MTQNPFLSNTTIMLTQIELLKQQHKCEIKKLKKEIKTLKKERDKYKKITDKCVYEFTGGLSMDYVLKNLNMHGCIRHRLLDESILEYGVTDLIKERDKYKRIIQESSCAFADGSILEFAYIDEDYLGLKAMKEKIVEINFL